MTNETRRSSIDAELERGREALRAARNLLEDGLPCDSVSRAYYGVFHHARALCLAIGEEPRSHQGVAHLLSLHFVRPGTLPADVSRRYAVLQRYRESADYDAAFVLDAEGARAAVEDAVVLASQIETVLRMTTRELEAKS